jgi:hypothetical protein
MNLTAVTERDAVMERHVMDSLALLPVVESAYSAHCCSSDKCDERLKVVDVGSGAGLPGLILAIARPGASHAVGCHIQACCRLRISCLRTSLELAGTFKLLVMSPTLSALCISYFFAFRPLERECEVHILC